MEIIVTAFIYLIIYLLIVCFFFFWAMMIYMYGPLVRQTEHSITMMSRR